MEYSEDAAELEARRLFNQDLTSSMGRILARAAIENEEPDKTTQELRDIVTLDTETCENIETFSERDVETAVKKALVLIYSGSGRKDPRQRVVYSGAEMLTKTFKLAPEDIRASICQGVADRFANGDLLTAVRTAVDTQLTHHEMMRAITLSVETCLVNIRKSKEDDLWYHANNLALIDSYITRLSDFFRDFDHLKEEAESILLDESLEIDALPRSILAGIVNGTRMSYETPSADEAFFDRSVAGFYEAGVNDPALADTLDYALAYYVGDYSKYDYNRQPVDDRFIIDIIQWCVSGIIRDRQNGSEIGEVRLKEVLGSYQGLVPEHVLVEGFKYYDL
jgi:hypothetical protein